MNKPFDPAAGTGAINFTVITSEKPQILTKVYTVDGQGTLQNPQTKANLVKGKAQIHTATSMAEFVKIRSNLATNQALMMGVFSGAACGNSLDVYSQKEYERLGKPQGAVTRQNKNCEWSNGSGLMMLDYDPQGDETPLSREQFISTVSKFIPLNETSFAHCYSSSSFIFVDGVQVRGAKGQRIYVAVKDAGDIERAAKVLFDRLWLAGFGFYVVSEAGSLLERSVIDSSVFQTSRLDFAAGAACGERVTQQHPEPIVNEGSFLDTKQVLKDLTPAELAELEVIKRKAKLDIAPQAENIKALYVQDRALETLTKHGITQPNAQQLEEAKNIIKRAVDNAVLYGDFPIYLDDNTAVSVGEILDNPSKYHKRKTKDPLEPEYNGRKTTGILYLFDGRPCLYSQAHGGRTFKLFRQPRRIEYTQGQSLEAIAATVRVLKNMHDVFCYGSNLVFIFDGRPIIFTPELLTYYVAGVVQYFTRKKDRNGNAYEILLDPPQSLIKQILSTAFMQGFKPLNAVITAPTITPDNHVINRAGYDTATGIYLATNEDMPYIPDIVSADDVAKAVEILLEPVKDFPFVSSLDRSVCFSAMLTAAVRAVLPTAPAYAMDAPKQGTGKTYLAQCIGYLYNGSNVAAMPPLDARNDDETRKRLFSELLKGSRVILWDNVMGVFNSGSLAAMLTSPDFNDRILGKSESSTAKNKALFLLTGNNLEVAGELPRRILISRLDSQMENPLARTFSFNPLKHIEKHRLEIIAAAIVVIRGYLQTVEHELGGIMLDKLASFEDWDTLARQPVAWLATEDSRFEDPKKAIDLSIMVDPEQQTLSDLLHAIADCRGIGTFFEAKELLQCMESSFYTELADIFKEFLPKDNLNSRSVGKVLSWRRDRVADGLRLVMVQNGKKAAKFKIEKV